MIQKLNKKRIELIYKMIRLLYYIIILYYNQVRLDFSRHNFLIIINKEKIERINFHFD